ncbi:MAG: hypothetical protein COY19_07110 [Candidatus Marinimicrobia bacterium CG_4_10_14_0_2_um_filter_48_9]|nr:MAG: hypothetical protein COY19_07110 [Candidatus Marinimicrobia bacterium CG_4_10_14_0_2_um_filter_48_9]
MNQYTGAVFPAPALRFFPKSDTKIDCPGKSFGSGIKKYGDDMAVNPRFIFLHSKKKAVYWLWSQMRPDQIKATQLQ